MADHLLKEQNAIDWNRYIFGVLFIVNYVILIPGICFFFFFFLAIYLNKNRIICFRNSPDSAGLLKIDLKGIAIGNGYVDQIMQVCLNE